VMYEMLTGVLPIQAQSEVQMLIGHVSTPPEPIRTRRPELSAGIGAVVMRCLEKDPARRPASGAALIAQIENYENGGTAATAPNETPTVATQRPVPLAAASPAPERRLSRLAIVLIALGIAGGARYLIPRTKPPARSAVAVKSHAVSLPTLQDTPIPPPPVPAEPRQVPEAAPTAAPTAGKPLVPRPRVDVDANPADAIQKALDAIPMDAATKAQTRDISRQAKAMINKGDYEGAARQYQRLTQLRPGWEPAIAALGEALAAGAVTPQMHVQNRTSFLSSVIAQYSQAVRLNPNVAINHYLLGRALGRSGDLSGDMREQQEALRLDPRLASAHNQLGYVHAHQESWSDAAREYREAIRLKTSRSHLAEAHSGLGDALGHMGDWQGEIAEERVAIQQDPKLAVAHFQLATALEHEGDSSTALEEYRRAAQLDPGEANFQASYQRLASQMNAK
jgi:tetratricopeptide (TPR) repeat protein